MKSMLLMVLAAAAAWGQSVYAGGSMSTGGTWGSASTICGPPLYPCSTTSLATIQLPALPNVGNLSGLATLVTPSDFNNAIVRVTDTNLDSTITGGTYVIDPGGSGDRNMWNTDSTLLTVSSTGTRGYILNFNPSTMAVSNRYSGSFILNLKGTFSFANKFLFYGVIGTSTAISQWDFTSPSTMPSATTLYDFSTSSNCLGSSYSSTIADTLSTSKIPADSVFATAFSNSGGQGTGVDVVAYKVGSGCSHLNTQTGVVTGDWGTTGTISSLADRFSIHEVRLSQNGRYMLLAKTTCFTTCAIVPYVWEIGTLNLTLVCTVSCSGHFSTGFNTWVNNNGSPLFQWQSRLLTSPGSSTPLIATFPSGEVTPVDHHSGWANANASDTNLFFATQTETGSYCCFGNYPSAWYAEVNGLDPTGVSGVVKRFAHTYATGESLIFDTQQAIGSVSQDGRFYAFSTDWMGSLGNNDGVTSTCVGGGADWKASTAYATAASCAGTSANNTSCVIPETNNVGVNSVGYVFRASAGGTSGAPPGPTVWNQTVGGITTDGTVTWTNVGQPNCRGDVFAVELR
jgi:hypothetical protein